MSFYTNTTEDLPDDKRTRLNAWVPTEDYEHIRAVYPGKGVFAQIISHTIANICKELKQHGITYYRPDLFPITDRILVKYSTSRERPTIIGSPSEVPLADVTEGAVGLCPQTTTTPPESSDYESTPHGGSRTNTHWSKDCKVPSKKAGNTGRSSKLNQPTKQPTKKPTKK